jgi:type VI protein secretion system component VasF
MDDEREQRRKELEQLHKETEQLRKQAESLDFGAERVRKGTRWFLTIVISVAVVVLIVGWWLFQGDLQSIDNVP